MASQEDLIYSSIKPVYDYLGRSISSDPNPHIPPDRLQQCSNRLESKRKRKRFGG